VINTNPFVNLGKEENDLIKIVVAIFDLEGFTNFFNNIPVNKNIVITQFINGLLYWFNYHFKERFTPNFAKFLGDGLMLIWEPSSQKLTNADLIYLMNRCWDCVQAPSSFHREYLPEFKNKIGKRWQVEFPK